MAVAGHHHYNMQVVRILLNPFCAINCIIGHISKVFWPIFTIILLWQSSVLYHYTLTESPLYPCINTESETWSSKFIPTWTAITIPRFPYCSCNPLFTLRLRLLAMMLLDWSKFDVSESCWFSPQPNAKFRNNLGDIKWKNKAGLGHHSRQIYGVTFKSINNSLYNEIRD